MNPLELTDEEFTALYRFTSNPELMKVALWKGINKKLHKIEYDRLVKGKGNADIAESTEDIGRDSPAVCE